MTVRLRGSAAVVTAAGVVVLGAVLAPSATAAPAPATTAGAIHPGVLTDTEGGGSCTTNFIFASGDRTFIGQAAHCAGTGTATETNGCDSATGGIGTKVTIKAEDGSERVGTLAYSSWVAMQAKGETDADTCAFNDFALVEIDPADEGAVDPTVPYFGGPTGLRTDALQPGEQVYSYGNSPLRLGIGALSPKAGIVASEHASGRSHEVYTLTPGIPGDSGSGFVDGSGRAFGVLSTLNLAPLPVSNGIADLAKAIEYAEANSDLTSITLVEGDKAFTPTPVGIPLDLLAIPAVPPLPA